MVEVEGISGIPGGRVRCLDGFFLVVRSSEVEDDVDERASCRRQRGWVGLAGGLVIVADARGPPPAQVQATGLNFCE